MMRLPPPLPSSPLNYPQPPALINSAPPQFILLTEPKNLSTSAGIGIFMDAWRLLKGNFWLWLGVVLFYFIAMVIPGINFVASLLTTFFIAGISYMAHQQTMGEVVKFDQLFRGFEKNTGQLFLLILFNFLMLLFMIITLVIVFFVFNKIFNLVGSSPATSKNLSPLNWLIISMACLMFSAYALALWLAPVLITIHNVSAIKALKLSLKAGIKNMGAMLVLGLISLLAIIVAILPLGLGLLVVFPLLQLTYYTSYRAMFIQPLNA